MGRTLAHGRLSKEEPGEAFRQNGLIAALGNKGIFGNHLDQLLFEAHGYEHILGSTSQVASDFATMTWDQAQQRFEDKSGAEVVLSHYERIAGMGMDTLTDNIVLDNLTGLEIFHIGNTPGQTGDNPKFQLGNKGGGEPYKIKLGPNTKDCKLDLLTDKPFEELPQTLTPDQKRYIANQGRNNHIRVNGQDIYNPSHTGEIVQFDALPANPYLVRMNGGMNHWIADASNVNLAWFRDLNIFLDGLRSDGTVLQETQSRFTEPATIAANPWLFQVNMSNRFLTDLTSDPPDGDTRIHDRTDPFETLIQGQVDTFGNNIVRFQVSFPLAYIKNNMRIQQPGIIPGESSATTIIRNYNSTTREAEMFDALTGDPVIVGNFSFIADLDNSGAVGGSHDEDAFQNITGEFHSRRAELNSSIISSISGAFSVSVNAGGSQQQLDRLATVSNADIIQFDASDSTAEGGARTHNQTQPRSTVVRFYYRP